MAVEVERWGYVTTSGAELVVELLHAGLGWSRWCVGEAPVWELDPESCVRDAAAALGHEVERVLRPSELVVELRLSRESARAWLKLLAQWCGGGTLGEPGDELRAELARALGEGAGCG